jgi:arylsulfatase
MDKLHGESVRFTDFHVAPMCTPTRGQLMSGMDALRNGATSVTAGRAMLRPGIPTAADMFKAAGYRTGLFGKWHLGDNYPYRPMERGFDTAKYHLGFGMSSAPEFDNDYFNGRYHDNGVEKRFEGYCTDFWFGEAMKYMSERKAKNEPFFVYLPTNTPHGPAWVAEKYSAPYRKPGQPADFFGMIANLDENLGKMEEFLRTSGLRDNTIVVFMTDNGGTAGVNVFNSGMRDKKTAIYDGGHRVPCFVRWPAAKVGGGRDVDVNAQVQDILPTLLELTKVAPSPAAKFTGKSLAPLLRDGTASLADRMLVVQYGQIPAKWEACVIWKKWRLIRGEELYDLGSDPGQKKDIARDNKAVVAKMRAHYESWWSETEPTLKNYAAVTLGSDKENPTILSCSDWQDIYCDNPRHVSEAAGGPRGGPWNVVIERPGTYDIELFRWLPRLNLPLSSGRAPQKMTAGSLPEGKALPVAAAQLRIAGQSLSGKASNPQASNIKFEVKLRGGGERTQLHGWFQDASGNDLSGAFYARITRRNA